MYQVQVLTAEEWKQFSNKSHIVVFGYDRPSELDRVDLARIVIHKGEVGGFITCKEMDAETCYIQHGGVYPNFEKSLHVLRGYMALLNDIKSMYKIVWTRVENTNIPMLKMALSQGFIINGCSKVKNKLYLELILEV